MMPSVSMHDCPLASTALLSISAYSSLHETPASAFCASIQSFPLSLVTARMARTFELLSGVFAGVANMSVRVWSQVQYPRNGSPVGVVVVAHAPHARAAKASSKWRGMRMAPPVGESESTRRAYHPIEIEPGRRLPDPSRHAPLPRRGIFAASAHRVDTDPDRRCRPHQDATLRQARNRPQGVHLDPLQHRGKDDADLVKRERHAEARTNAAAEGKPLRGTRLLLDEAHGVELERIGPDLGISLDVVDARRHEDARRKRPTGDRRRPFEAANDGGGDGVESKRFLSDGFGVVELADLGRVETVRKSAIVFFADAAQ